MERAALSQALRAWRSRELRAGSKEPICIAEALPEKFMAAFAEAVAGEADIFLCDPQWGAAEKAQVTALLGASSSAPSSRRGWLCIPTGGSGGRVKFARHDTGTVAAAVHGFTQHFKLPRVNAMGVLPLHHVSGFMAWMRCVLTGGDYVHQNWKAIEQGPWPSLPEKTEGWVISLVPTQLERLMRDKAAAAWLGRFRIVFLGGAPAPAELLERAAAARIPLAPGYGMTETAAMVTALRPEEFLAGSRSSGRALPHARLSVAADGVIRVEGDSLFRGYFPEQRAEGAFVTNDLGRLDGQGQLHITGRHDEVIITGGEKVNPGEIEAILRGPGGLTEVAVVGKPDAEWGQVVVAAYPASSQADPASLERLASQLAPAKRPKLFIPLETWPLTSAGKVNRVEVARLVCLAKPLQKG